MAIKPIEFYDHLVKHSVEFFTGVPDSLLKHFCFCIDDNIPKERHIIAANEGNAIALAAGYHLATGKLPLVYMQNSGLGNAVNPLLSLCDPEVYSIPMLILIGWRGEPDINDEPQHAKQGKIQLDLLNTMDIPYVIISKEEKYLERKITSSIKGSIKENRPFAIIVKKGAFEPHRSTSVKSVDSLLSRESSLKIILKYIPDNSIIISTTGKTSREIFEIREKNNHPHYLDFLTVGSMGHCSSIALGIAIARPREKVVCIDGDGSLIMHMGSLSTVGKLQPKNYYHILINNYVHESVGGQETSAKNIDIQQLVKSNGYKNVISLNNTNRLINEIKDCFLLDGPLFMELKVKPGSRKNLGRPTLTPIENKLAFMKFLRS